MGDLFLLNERQMARILPYFPLLHGVPRVDDRRVVSGIVYVIRNGLQWKDAPAGYGPHKTLYNRFIRWSRLGVFDRIFAALAGEGPKPERMMIDATQGPLHRGEPAQKGDVPRRIGRTKGGLNSKLHAACDGEGRPLILLVSEGQMSDHKGARLVLDALPPADTSLQTGATTVRGSAKNSKREASSPVSRHRRAARRPSPTTRCSTASATRSRTSSPSSRTGGASQPATIDAPIPSSPPSASQPPSSSGSDQ